jgi:hypothetical protein
MRRESFDALFSDFFSRDFLSLILTKHRKNKKNNQFFNLFTKQSIFLRNDEKTIVCR